MNFKIRYKVRDLLYDFLYTNYRNLYNPDKKNYSIEYQLTQEMLFTLLDDDYPDNCFELFRNYISKKSLVLHKIICLSKLKDKYEADLLEISNEFVKCLSSDEYISVFYESVPLENIIEAHYDLSILDNVIIPLKINLNMINKERPYSWLIPKNGLSFRTYHCVKNHKFANFSKQKINFCEAVLVLEKYYDYNKNFSNLCFFVELDFLEFVKVCNDLQVKSKFISLPANTYFGNDCMIIGETLKSIVLDKNDFSNISLSLNKLSYSSPIIKKGA